MFSVHEIAQRLGVSPTCVYQLIQVGKIACHRIGIGRGAIRIAECDLQEYLTSSRSERALPDANAPTKTRRGNTFRHLRLGDGDLPD